MTDKNLYIRDLLSLLLIAVMTALASLLDSQEIIFPEIGALVLGLWVIEKQVWKVRRWQIPWLFTFAAVMGVLIVRCLPLPLPCRMEVGFLVMALALMVLRASMTPAISACMLPVLMGTDSWVYPLAVFCLTSLLCLGQWVLERTGLRARPTHEPSFNVAPTKARIMLRWLALMLILLPVLVVTDLMGWKFAVVPPLIVTLVEFSNAGSGFRQRPVAIWLTIVACAIVGATAEGLLHQWLLLPQWLCATLASALILGSGYFRRHPFAPALAIALVPMIIPDRVVPWFPLYVACGAAYFIAMAEVCFRRKMPS